MIKDELNMFNIDMTKIKPNNNLFENIEEAINEMRKEFYKENLEVILNKNLIYVKHKLTGIKTIFGCKVTFRDLEENISFVIRPEEGIYEKSENIY